MTSISKASQSKGDTSYAKEINLGREEEEEEDNPEEDDTYQENTKKKRKDSADFHSSNAKESFDRDDVSNYFNSRHSNEKEVDEEATESEEASNLVRLPRDVNGDFDRYTGQDEGSSLYDDYEAKDVAKRGILSGQEDYEEIENDLGTLEDTVAVQESTNEARRDARVKRDQAEISEMPRVSSPDDPAKLEESKAEGPYSCKVSCIELSKSFNEAPNDASKIKGSGSKDVISKLNDSSKLQEQTNEVISSEKNEPNAEYEKRVEEEIQRKIDSLKEGIQRDVQVQQRVRDIEDNNARFDELQEQEYEDKERKNFKDEPIEKRQTVERFIYEIADDTAASSKTNEKERILKRGQHKKRQRRSNKIEKSNASRENEDLKKRFVANHDKSSEQLLSKDLLKKKRERARQIFLVNNDQHQTKKRQSRSYTLPSDRIAVRPENELFMNPDSNAYLHENNRMVRLRKTG